MHYNIQFRFSKRRKYPQTLLTLHKERQPVLCTLCCHIIGNTQHRLWNFLAKNHNWNQSRCLNLTTSYNCRQESLRRNGVAHIVNKRVQNTLLRGKLQNNRMFSVCFRGKSFNITIIQFYPQPLMLKKLKLNGSIKTYKTFQN